MSISTSHTELCVAICSNTSTVQAEAMGTGRCLLSSPLHRQRRRVSKELLSIIVSPPIKGRVVTSFNGDLANKNLIAKSTCEAELIASSEALQQGENISIVISEMIIASCDIEVSSDNAAALHMVRNGSETAWRTRHISVKALWLHQMSRRGIKFTYQPTSEMAADSLMKGLGASRLPQIKEDLCLVDD